MKIKFIKEQKEEKTISQRSKSGDKNNSRHTNGIPKEWPDDWKVDPNLFSDFADEPLPGMDLSDDDDEAEFKQEDQLRTIIKQEVENILSSPQVIRRLAAIIKRS